MSEQVGPFHVVDLTPARRVWLNVLDLPGPKHCMYGLLEVDVTVPRQFIAEHKARTGETLSFTGFLTFCLARAVDEDKAVQAYLKGRKQLVLFDDVNVGLMVEQKQGEKRALMGHLIQGANHKTYLEIHQEIRSVQPMPISPSEVMPSWTCSVMSLPLPLSRLFITLLRIFTAGEPPPGWPPLLAQLMLGYAMDLFVDTAKVAGEFGVRLTSLDEYIKGLLPNTPVRMG
jgi:hypothetical protein